MRKIRGNLIYRFLSLLIIAAVTVGFSVGCDDSAGKLLLSSIYEGRTTGDEEYTSSSKDDETSKETTKGETQTSSQNTTEESGDRVTTDTETSIEATTTDKPTTTKPTTAKPTTAKPTTTKPTTSKEETTTKTITADKIYVYSPQASGKLTSTTNGVTIDYSNAAAEGYVMVKYSGDLSNTYKVRITSSSGKIDVYEFTPDGTYKTITLSRGADTYTVGIYIMISETKGSAIAKFTDITCSTDTKGFTYPNSMISYTATSAAVAKSYEICAGLTSDSSKVTAIYNYIIKNIKYDYNKASSGESTRSPNADVTLSTGKGVCSDYSCLFAVMCRAQRIPTRMEFGYIYPGSNGKSVYHAWNYVYYGGSWHFVDSTKSTRSKGSVSYTTNEIF